MNASITFANLTNQYPDGTAGVVWGVVGIALALLTLIACWRVFQKAKKPGWAAIIPIYDAYVLLKIVGRPGWWLLLYLIPVVNAITHIIVSVGLAKAFRKSGAFGFFWLFLFPFVGYWVLGFGQATYRGVPKH
jgi:hypothetical protein